MKKGQNHNHPKKDSQIKVEPIKSLKDIETIKKLLANKPRDLALFTIGINTNVRASARAAAAPIAYAGRIPSHAQVLFGARNLVLIS